MSATTIFSCGCSITRVMDETHAVFDVYICEKHKREHPEIIEFLLKKVMEFQDEKKETS